MRFRFGSWWLALIVATPCAAQTDAEGFIPTPDGTRLFYQKSGHGAQTIIAPGRLFLLDFLKPLGDTYTIIAYDMRNRGRSDYVADTAKIGIDQDVADLETVRRHFAVPRPHLIGYSYLGLMVMLYASAHPSRVDRIVQLGPVPRIWDTAFPAGLRTDRPSTGVDSASVARLEELRRQGVATADPQRFCEAKWSVDRFGLVGNPANVDRVGQSRCAMPNEWPDRLERHLRIHFPSVQRRRTSWADFQRVASPVLTIHGTRDRNAPYGGGREWALHIPNARLVTIRDAAHQAFAEYPDIVLTAVRTFLAGRWPVEAEHVVQLMR